MVEATAATEPTANPPAPPQHPHHSTTKPKTGGVAADASFLETIDSTSASASASSSSISSSSLVDLHRSNLLRLQAEQLVSECQLVPVPTAHSAAAKQAPSWTSQIGPYVDVVTSLLEKVSLDNIAAAAAAAAAGGSNKACPFVLQSDYAADRCLESLVAANAKGASASGNTKKLPLFHVMPFCPPTQRQAAASSSILGGCGSLTNASGNANVLPTFDLVVQLPNHLWDAKDYLKHRYLDKRKLIVWHVAQQLTQHKKSKAKLGTIYWAYDHQDVRKPCLILVPPVATKSTDGNTANKKRKQTNTATATSAPKSPKFRIQILFEMESIDWIPPLRLVPNRCNLAQEASSNKKSKMTAGHYNTAVGSPMYNHALLEDAYHSAFVPNAAAEKQRRRKLNDNDNDDDDDDDGSRADDDDNDDDEQQYPHWMGAVVLAKIWCLQRGLLRAHDGFTTDHLALLILYLYRTKQANPRMAPLQVLAALFKCLSDTRWFGNKDDGSDGGGNDAATDDKNLIRQSPSEASSFYGNKAASNTKTRRKKRAVLVLPSLGRAEAQTIAHASLAKLYAKQTKESPLTSNDPKSLVELYRQVCPGPVLLDPSLRFNYLQRISPTFMRLARSEAAKSIQYLHSPSIANSSIQASMMAVVDKPFAALFMSPARFWDRHDLYFKVPLSLFRKDAATLTCGALYSTALRADFGEYEALARALTGVLRQALGDRIASIQILSNGNGVLGQQQGAETLAQPFLDSDQIPLYEIQKGQSNSKISSTTSRVSPRGDDNIVLGVSLNVDTCHRIVDRGPPADDSSSIQTFLDLWGNKAELRRFKDGAIVQAVVWNTTKNEPGMNNNSYVRYQNEDAMQGGIVERIISFVLHRHFLSTKRISPEKSIVKSPLRDMTSVIDGVAVDAAAKDDTRANPWFSNPTLAHRNIMKSFEELAGFLREHSLPSLPVPGTLEEKTSRLGMPLAIDAVEPLSPCLRYSDLFPPLPHPFLGSPGVKGLKKTAGVITSEPVCIQIRFGASSKWPTDLKAIGAAKTAMLIQLANGIEQMQATSRGECEGFAGPVTVTPSYLDLGFRGYMFRIEVRADPEIRLLRGLFKPSIEAAALLRTLTRENVVSAMHHSMIHAIHTKHASAGGVVRMATRWVAGHMLSGLIPHEAIEMLVARVYTDRNSPLEAPGSVAAGFLRFLQLLETHDWVREPLIVDPVGHIDDEDRSAIMARFEQMRGPNHEGGSPMYIISPNDRQGIDDIMNNDAAGAGDTGASQKTPSFLKDTSVWTPSFTTVLPEWVIMTRMITLARKSRSFLVSKLTSFEPTGWSAAFHETTNSFKAYSALLRIDSDFAVDETSSSTGNDLGPVGGGGLVLESAYTKSIQERYVGPKALRLRLYRNMRDTEMEQQALIHDWRPVDALVESLRRDFGSLALFFYNHLCPDVIAVLWRPHVFSSHSFSVMASEYTQPCVAKDWKADTMMMLNVDDIIREMRQSCNGIVTKVKLFQAPSLQRTSATPPTPAASSNEKKKRKSSEPAREESSSSDSDDDDNDNE